MGGLKAESGKSAQGHRAECVGRDKQLKNDGARAPCAGMTKTSGDTEEPESCFRRRDTTSPGCSSRRNGTSNRSRFTLYSTDMSVVLMQTRRALTCFSICVV